MNRLPIEKRTQILHCLVEGMSMRATSGVVGVSINTVNKLLVDAGHACAAYHEETVRNVKARRVECDQIWSFCYAKQGNTHIAKARCAEDVWTWTAFDADSKLIIAYGVGDQTSNTASEFVDYLRMRLVDRVQLTIDGNKTSLEAVEGGFGGDVDYAQLVKLHGVRTGGDGHERKCSSAECVGANLVSVEGSPVGRNISTSSVEHQNLSMRMGICRFTRLTSEFSNRLENHLNMLSLYFVHYNFCRIHKSLRVSPAMEAGITDKLRNLEWIVGQVDACVPKPNRPKNTDGLF